MTGRRRVFILAAVLLACGAATAPPAVGATSIQVEIGWDGMVRAGRWNVAFVTLSDTTTRNVTLEFHTPYDNYHALGVNQSMTIGPEAQTFPLYLPLWSPSVSDMAIIVRDARTRKKLAEAPSASSTIRGGDLADPSKYFLGVSGNRATLRPVIDALPGAMLQAGYMEPDRLPTDAIGFDALDVLVLNAAEFASIAPEQQQAIADWVRAGGSLVFWPGDGPVPAAGPLVDLLPCRIGSATVIQLSDDQHAQAGLLPRFRKLTAHELTAAPDAEPVALLGTDRVTAYRGRAGFGRVVVSPVDFSALMFNDSTALWKAWRTLLEGTVRKLPTDAITPPQGFYGVSESMLREGACVRELGDLLGNVPGAGRFGFGYVAGVMLGMMVIVGPVDWFVLKRLGRQPWTWVTTGGWIALITLGAVYVGNLVKSGELHFRTFQLIDQVDGSAIARSDLTALYSPRTAEYDITTPAQSWWEPASPGNEFYIGARPNGMEVPFYQTYRDSRPEPMTVNVWNLRFLRGSAVGKGPALVEASLSIVGPADATQRLVGTVTNVGPTALKNLAVRTKGGICVFAARATSADRIEPGQTVNIDAVIDPEVRPSDEIDPNDPRLRGYYPNYDGQSGAQAADLARLWDAGGNLSVRRTDRVTQLLSERDDVASVYAECDPADPIAKLVGKPAIEQHWKVVRALVTLK